MNKASDGEGGDKLRLKLDGLVEIGKGTIKVTLAAIGVTAVLVRAAAGGVELDSAIEIANGAVIVVLS